MTPAELVSHFASEPFAAKTEKRPQTGRDETKRRKLSRDSPSPEQKVQLVSCQPDLMERESPSARTSKGFLHFRSDGGGIISRPIESKSMQFGQVDDPGNVDFSIPPDHPDTAKVLKAKASKSKELEVSVGCAKWNKKDLKNFYPKGVKDELAYYSTQFNCIELNATFYRLFSPETFDKWRETAPESFLFFPKLEQSISHFQRLKDVKETVERNVANMSHLKEKLGMPFLQMHNNFAPKDFDRVVAFAEDWTYDVPLAIEFRHTGWYNDEAVSSKLYRLLEKHRITNVLVDTAGRRDLMHMRLTTPTAFIRWVGANEPKSDRARLDKWVGRISEWKEAGLRKLFFFVHQNDEQESPALAAHFIKRLNKKIGTDLPIPKTLDAKGLFD
jgi:uncharacterized protein YecE (DUF72 family)